MGGKMCVQEQFKSLFELNKAKRASQIFRVLLLLAAAVSLTILVVGYQESSTAQSAAPQLSLDSPVSFPGDI